MGAYRDVNWKDLPFEVDALRHVVTEHGLRRAGNVVGTDELGEEVDVDAALLDAASGGLDAAVKDARNVAGMDGFDQFAAASDAVRVAKDVPDAAAEHDEAFAIDKLPPVKSKKAGHVPCVWMMAAAAFSYFGSSVKQELSFASNPNYLEAFRSLTYHPNSLLVCLLEGLELVVEPAVGAAVPKHQGSHLLVLALESVGSAHYHTVH